jgi:hypothetical protein
MLVWVVTEALKKETICFSTQTGFTLGSVHVGFVVDKWHWDRFFSEFFGFSLSVSFHRTSPYSYIIFEDE